MSGNSNNNNATTSSGRTGIEFDSKQIFKWTIEKFNLISRNRALINAQKIELHINATLGIPATIWSLSLSHPTVAEDGVESLKFNYKCQVKGGRGKSAMPMPMYIARVSYLKSSKRKRKKNDLQNTITGSWRISSKESPGDWNITLIDGALVLKFTLEFYRNRDLVVGDMNFPGDSWNLLHEHSKKEHLLEMLKSGYLSDIKLVSKDGQEFLAHKLILRSECEVFNAMFRHDMAESTSGVIILKDMSARAVNFLLHFLYSSQILPISAAPPASATGTEDSKNGTETDATFEEVLYLASKYGLKELTIHLEENIANFCKEENSMHLLKLCKLYSLEKGKEVLFEIVQRSQWNVLKDFLLSQL